MKILKIFPKKDNPSRYNYQVNFGVWDNIYGDSVILEEFDGNTRGYDVVLLPQEKRWRATPDLLNKIKDGPAKKVLFDNDSCYRLFTNPFYDGFDYIFWRDLDKKNNTPNTKNSWLPWSIDTNLYEPKWGGNGIAFNCTVAPSYPLRMQIKKIIRPTNYKGDLNIRHLQNSGAAIHTDNHFVPVVRAKVLEFGACGTQIISNRTQKMDYFYPDDLIIYFHDMKELKEIIKKFKPNIEIQKELRRITVEKHDNKIRAGEVLNKLKEIV